MDYREHKIMEQKDKELLLKDLCARLPYGIIGAVSHYSDDGKEVILQGKITGFNKCQIKLEYLLDYTDDIGAYNWFDINLVKPYLRPLSTMTEEEKIKLSLSQIYAFAHYNEIAKIDWLNAHHFDYRGLINRGLAIEVTEDNNPYKY